MSNSKTPARTASEISNNPSDDAPRYRKLAAHFVDELTNVSVSPNGACRLYFTTWSVDQGSIPVRVESEVIMTTDTLNRLADVLPRVLSQLAESKNVSSSAAQDTERKTVEPELDKDDASHNRGSGLFRNRKH
ncbi:MAG: hypothetical protein DHS20C01_29280 [marine bacterium B5-7]|nr:MAG: hypothetical protein DHS20C01_29280 [marine bacterium B5-7]